MTLKTLTYWELCLQFSAYSSSPIKELSIKQETETINCLGFEWQLSPRQVCEDMVWQVISLALIEKRVNTACRSTNAFKLVKVLIEKINIFLSVHFFMISFKTKQVKYKWYLCTNILVLALGMRKKTIILCLQVIPIFPLYYFPKMCFCCTVWHG